MYAYIYIVQSQFTVFPPKMLHVMQLIKEKNALTTNGGTCFVKTRFQIQ